MKVMFAVIFKSKLSFSINRERWVNQHGTGLFFDIFLGFISFQFTYERSFKPGVTNV